MQSELLSDPRLIARLADGDDAAIGALYDEYGTIAYSLAMAVTDDASAAEGAVARSFAQLADEAAQFQSTGESILAWLARAVRRHALAGRARQLTHERVQRLHFARETPLSGVRDMQQPAIPAALSRLSALQQRTIELAFLGGLTARQIARELQLPEPSVARELCNAMRGLRRARPMADGALASAGAGAP